MKFIVDEMPKKPSECIASQFDHQYRVYECLLSPNAAMECGDIKNCPYLIAISELSDKLIPNKENDEDDEIKRCKNCRYHNAALGYCIGSPAYKPDSKDPNDSCEDWRIKEKKES